ncbi:MAG: CBS domain-containing protein [Streptosporangiaceae bacterium]
MRISDILRAKGDTVVGVTPDATVRDLLENLAAHNVGALVVSTDGDAIEGIVSERDVVRHLARSGPELLDAPVSSIMTAEVRTYGPDHAVDELSTLMTRYRVRHVPIVVDGGLRGIVSIGDIVKARLDELQLERDQLTSYITGGH